jgi:hypothetical protein
VNIFEQHTSPDSLLRLLVTRSDSGDLSISFDKYTWHTHGSILAALSGLPESDAVRRFVEHVTGDEQIIVISRVNGKVQDVWPTDDPQTELKHKPPEESLEFRRWSGITVEIDATS